MTIEMEIDKLEEEVEELKEALKDGRNIDHIVEELADCFVALSNARKLIQKKFKFTNTELITMQSYKKARTNRRIQNGYYKNK